MYKNWDCMDADGNAVTLSSEPTFGMKCKVKCPGNDQVISQTCKVKVSDSGALPEFVSDVAGEACPTTTTTAPTDPPVTDAPVTDAPVTDAPATTQAAADQVYV